MKNRSPQSFRNQKRRQEDAGYSFAVDVAVAEADPVEEAQRNATRHWLNFHKLIDDLAVCRDKKLAKRLAWVADWNQDRAQFFDREILRLKRKLSTG